LAVVLAAFAPATAQAQYKHRQEKKNEWRNLAYAGAALGILGLVTKNNTLMWAGVGGGLYSAYRYEQDRKSQSKMDRQRAYFYGQSRVRYKGHTYTRKTVWKKGKKYYTFVRVR
jgi:hypothetical protein